MAIAQEWAQDEPSQGGWLFRRGPRQAPSFADLARVRWDVDAHGAPPGTYHRELARFESAQGRMVDSYWCGWIPGGVALTEKRPSFLARCLGRTSETRLHRMTEIVVRNEPEFARLLLEADRQAIRSTNVLSGMSRRLALFTLFASTRQILTFLEWCAAEKEDLRELTAAERRSRRASLARESTNTLETHTKILTSFRANYYDEAAARQAQIVYLAGMLKGFVALVVVAIALGVVLTELAVPGVDMTTFLGCLIAGGIGAVASVLMRMNSGKFSVNHELGREYLSRLGWFRPAIGAVFALLMYFTLRGGLLPNVNAPRPGADAPAQAFSWYLAVGFLMGFSERLAKEMVGRAESSVGATGGEVLDVRASTSSTVARRGAEAAEVSAP